MERHEYELKLKLINEKIDLKNEFMKLNRKNEIRLICIGVVVLIIVSTVVSLKPKMIATDVISISLVVSSLYGFIIEAIRERRHRKYEVEKLKMEKEYYENVIK